MWIVWLKLLITYTFKFKVEKLSTDTLSNVYQGVQIKHNYNFIAIIWCLGIIVFCIFNLYKYIKLKKLLAMSIPENVNLQGKTVKIYRNDFIDTALVNGIIKPKIYVSVMVDNSQLEYVYEHEAMHIKKHHNIIKVFTGILTIVYWFNPVIWFFYKAFVNYIEMVCDYECCKKYSNQEDWRNNYAKTLVNLAVNNRHINMRVLGFNNLSIERRVSVIMKKEKTKIIGVVTSGVVMLGVAMFLFVKPQYNIIKAEENNNTEAGQSQEVEREPQAIASEAKAKKNAAYDYKVEKYYTLLNDLQTIISNLNNDN